MTNLNNISLKILSDGKGILAADESTGTMTKRLESVMVLSNEENRLNFRKTLFSAESMKKCIGGVILYDETIKQTSGNKTIPEIINEISIPFRPDIIIDGFDFIVSIFIFYQTYSGHLFLLN